MELEDGAKYRTKDGKELTLSIKTYSSKPDLPKVSQTIASELEKLGIKVTVEVVDDISRLQRLGTLISWYMHSIHPQQEAQYTS